MQRTTYWDVNKTVDRALNIFILSKFFHVLVYGLNVCLSHSSKISPLYMKLHTDLLFPHESIFFVTVNQTAKEDTMVLKIGSVAMAPQADNPLGRSVLRKDIYQ